MKPVLLLFIILILGSCSDRSFLQQKYTHFNHAAHQRHHASRAASPNETVSSAAAPTLKKDEYLLPAQKHFLLSSITNETEEEPQKMGFLKWLMMIILLIPVCFVTGVVMLFQPHWWIGLIFIALGLLLLFSWLNSEAELFYNEP
jgi:hypothetical protein